jgi:hypothetical protein
LLTASLVADAFAQKTASGPSYERQIGEAEKLPDSPPSGRTQTDFAERYLNFTRVFDTAEVAYAGEALFRQQVAGLGVGEYRASAYHVDSIAATGQASSDGWQLAVEQDLGDVGLFLRGGALLFILTPRYNRRNW